MGCPLLLDLEPRGPTHLGPGPYKTPKAPSQQCPAHTLKVAALGPGSAQGALGSSLHRGLSTAVPLAPTHADVQASGQWLSIPSSFHARGTGPLISCRSREDGPQPRLPAL